MADTEVKISDNIAGSIAVKLREIKTEATAGASAVKQLQASLKMLNGGAGFKSAATSATQLRTALTQTTRQVQTLRTGVNTLNGTLATGAARANTFARNLNVAGQSAQRFGGQARNAGGSMSALTGALAGVVGVQTFITAADAAQTLSNKLRTVATSSKEFYTTQKQLFALAIENRTSIVDLATAYQRFSFALKGTPQAEVMEFVDTLTKSLVTFGATTAETGSVITQLSQAFTKGKLDGDEFRSMMENLPTMADALTAALGKSREELYALSKAGKITPAVILKAFKGTAQEIRDAFALTIPTIGQQLDVLNTKFIKFMSDNSTGAQVLGKWIEYLGDNLGVVIPLVVAFGAAWAVMSFVTLTAQVWGLVAAVIALSAPVVAFVAAFAVGVVTLAGFAAIIAYATGKGAEFEAWIVKTGDDLGIFALNVAAAGQAAINSGLGLDQMAAKTKELDAALDKIKVTSAEAGTAVQTIGYGVTGPERVAAALEKATTAAKGTKEAVTLAAGEIASLSGKASGVYDVAKALEATKGAAAGAATATGMVVTEIKSLSGASNGIYKVTAAIEDQAKAWGKTLAAYGKYQAALARNDSAFAKSVRADGTYPNYPSFENITGRMDGGSIQSLPGHSTGASFAVKGKQGTDKNLVAFRASRGERVDVQTKAQQHRGGGGAGGGMTFMHSAPISVTILTADAASFGRSRAQVTADMNAVFRGAGR